MLSWLGGRKSSSGMTVTAQSALSLSAYYAAIRNISEDVAKLPVKAIRRIGNTRQHVEAHPAGRILSRRPNADMTPMTLKEVVTAYALGWGNGYGEIVRDGRGVPMEIHPIHPARVNIVREQDGAIFYEIWQTFSFCGLDAIPTGIKARIPAADMLHIKGLGADGICGYSVASYAAESIGTGLAAQRFGAAFFGNNTTIGGFLKHPQTLSKEAQERLLESWEKRHKGSNKAHRMAILEEGMEYIQTSVNPRDAQFIELREFQVEEIARWFRIPPHKIQDLRRATFTNIESQGIEYVNDTLMPWIIRWEEEVKRKLIPEDDISIKFQVQAMMRGDAKARADFYRSQMNIGALSINEIREFEDMDPIGEEGDHHFMQINMATLEDIVSGEALKAKPPMGDNPGNMMDEPPAKPDEEKIMGALRPIAERTAKRINDKERKAAARAFAKHGAGEAWRAWIAQFMAEQTKYARDAFEPLVFSAASIVGASSEVAAEWRVRAIVAIQEYYAQRLAGCSDGANDPSDLELADAALGFMKDPK